MAPPMQRTSFSRLREKVPAGGRGEQQTQPLSRKLTPTYPRSPAPCDSLPRPAHRSEIMTSGWCAGGWVARESFRARPKVPRHGPVRWPSRYQRTGCSMWGIPVRQGCAHTQPGKVAMRVDSRSTATHAFRDVARDAPGSRYHKPKTPIGRRGESLFFCGLTASGRKPRRPRFDYSSTRGRKAGGGFVASVATSSRRC